MSCNVTRLFVIGMISLLATLPFAGCLAQESDGHASDESASEVQPASIRPRLTCTSPNIHEAINPFACQSGWPGARQCKQDWISQTDVVSVVALISGPNGEVSHTVTADGQQIELVAIVHEGNAFNPGSNTTVYNVEYCRKPI
jgi:hypothetical protein